MRESERKRDDDDDATANNVNKKLERFMMILLCAIPFCFFISASIS